MNRGHDEISYFNLDKGIIREYTCSLEEYTEDLFDKCFRETSKFIRTLESEGEECLY